MKIIGYYVDDKGLPIAYMKENGLIVFSNKDSLLSYKKLGGITELHAVLSNINYYNRIHIVSGGIQMVSNSNSIHKGGGGFFGESEGRCGWGDSPSCCFSSCAPLWRTNVWPFDFTM